MDPTWLIGGACALGAGVAAAAIGRRAEGEKERAQRRALEIEVESTRAAAAADADAVRRTVQLEARQRIEAERLRAEEEAGAAADEEARRALALEHQGLELERRSAAILDRGRMLEEREEALQTCECCADDLTSDAAKLERERRQMLEQLAGEAPELIKSRLVSEWVEGARAAAADRVRRIEAGVNDAEHVRTAKRIMEVAIQRYQGHYLTERLLTNVPIPIGSLSRILGEEQVNQRAIEEVSHVTLLPADTEDTIRLDGQDSFGREIARRAIARFGKNPVKPDAVRGAVDAIAAELTREVFELGKRAFRELEIPRAHPDIVALVGKLQYRTSYTQNQWKHAVETGFLCGMIADELRLDVKVARRAALMHDVGKALTHEIDGSHALIGADLARRLGETEVVANAIGAHHTEEPFNTTYAYLVAAADALSGGRPGARRQQDENFVERVADLERLAGGFSGVDRAYAVHGGREVRVHVKEDRVSDARAVTLSAEIARRISDELVFPGQIKVTVIREVKAVGVAN